MRDTTAMTRPAPAHAHAPWGAYAIFKDIDGNRFVMSAG